MDIQRVDSLNVPMLEQNLGYTGLDSWGKFILDTYRFKSHRIVAYDNNLPVGVIVLVEIRHPVFGHYLTTAPYGSYGGIVFGNEGVLDTLLDETGHLARQLGVKYVTIRKMDDGTLPPKTWVPDPIYHTYRVVLPATAQELLESYSANHRNHIRKSLKQGNVVRFGHLELLDDAYKGLSVSMHELGSPYHRKSYLQKMAETLGNTLEFAVLYNMQGNVAGSGVFITQGLTVSNLHANVIKKYRSSYAGELLYWSVIDRAISKKMRIFDLGRSLVNSGNEVFKLKWVKEKTPLSYWYWLAPNHKLPSINQRNPHFQAAIAIWKRLPLPLANILGTYIIRGLA